MIRGTTRHRKSNPDMTPQEISKLNIKYFISNTFKFFPPIDLWPFTRYKPYKTPSK